MDLSIIIPAYNEEIFIRQCCDAIVKQFQGTCLDYEVIVVDNGSTDGTASIASGFQPVSVYSIERSSVSKARNFGFQQSTGRILAFIDADVVITREWQEEIETLCAEESVSPTVTGCQYIVRENPSWIERHWFSCMNSGHINGGNLIVSRKAFEIVGGFNESLKTGEDVDFCNRATGSQEILYRKNERFVAIHLGYPRDLGHFVRREAWHGEGDFASLRYFLKSKVAVVSSFYFSAQLAIILLFALGYFYYSFLVFVVLFVVNLLIAIYRFRESDCSGLLSKSVLNYFYFTARFWSLIQACQKRRKSY